MGNALHFLIIGNPVTKKNSQQIMMNPKTKRPFIMPSSKYKRYERDAVGQLLLQIVKTALSEPIDYPVNVQCVYYMETKRRVDLVNLLESSLDCLVEAGILKDDNCSIAYMHDGSRVSYDKTYPRVEITITRMYGGT